jgi:hypothetical protein
MKTFSILIIIMLLLTACNAGHLDFNEIAQAQGYAEQKMKEKGIITATSSKSNDYVKFRIMSKDRLNNEDGRQLIDDFINLLEERIGDKDLFNRDYKLTFDIKSGIDGKILYKGKRDKGSKEIWWQF